MTIKTKVIASLLSAVTVPLLIIMLLIAWQVRDTAVTQYEQQARAEIQHIDNTFSLYLNGLAEDARFLSETPAIKRLTAQTTNYLGAEKNTRTKMSGDPEAEAFAVMNAFGETRPDLMYVFLALETGGYIQWPAGKMGNYDPRSRPWYQAAIGKRGQPIRPPAYEDLTTGMPLLDYLYHFSTDSGLQGVVGVDVSLKKLAEMVKQVRFGEQGYLILMEDTGTVLADSANPDNNFKAVNSLPDSYQALFNTDGLQTVEKNGEVWYAITYQSPQLGWKFSGLIPQHEVYAQANMLLLEVLAIGAVLLIIFALLAYGFSGVLTRPINTVTEGMENVASGEGDLTRRLNADSPDETGKMASAFNRFISMVHTLAGDINQGADRVKIQAEDTLQVSRQLADSADKQYSALEMTSTAFHEMVATTTEVSRNCHATADTASDSQKLVEEGQRYLQNTAHTAEQLVSAVQEANSSMSALAEDSKNITGILDTIRDIADQTNLLALNAAIEAARAGDQGRGFAVVADEVRTLAARTASSTEEIDGLITAFLNSTDDVASKLSDSLEYSRSGAESTNQTREVFSRIQESVNRIHDMSAQIATATEEQQQVSEEINQNITRIHEEAGEAARGASHLQDNASQLGEVSGQLTQLIQKFRI
ncbi:MAG: methyl-accepting chemotaxis protein [Marinobacterium sp.]|nr:methyl-accepting chemotaxis protein [Marinobacterium sp.]